MVTKGASTKCFGPAKQILGVRVLPPPSSPLSGPHKNTKKSLLVQFKRQDSNLPNISI